MKSSYLVPFISNALPSLAAARQYPEMLYFLESMPLILLHPEYIFLQQKARSRFAKQGYRVDKHVTSSIEFLRQIRRHPYGIVHLHLNSHQDVSFAAILIGSIIQDAYQIYISGLNPLEQNKITSAIDPKLQKLPSHLNVQNALHILEHFKKPFYIERFRQNFYSLPCFSHATKEDLMKIVEVIRALKYRKTQIGGADIKLVNAALISEYWLKYNQLLQQLLEQLAQNTDQKNLYSAKLMLSIVLPDAKWYELKEFLLKQISFEEQEAVSRIGRKIDFVNFLASFLLNTSDKNLKGKVQDEAVRIIFLNRLRVDSAILQNNKVKFISPISEEQSKLKSTLISLATNFYDKSRLQTNSIADDAQVSTEAKRIYTTELASLIMHSHRMGHMGQAAGLNVGNYSLFCREVDKFLTRDVFSVDKIVINAVIKSDKNLGFIVSKVLSQIQIDKKQAQKIIREILIFVNPYYDILLHLLDTAKKSQVGAIKRIQHQQEIEYAKRSFKILPKLDYVILTKELSGSEKSIFTDAKLSLGMKVFNDDYSGIKDYRHQVGYSQMTIPPIYEIPPLAGTISSWLYDAYHYFVEYNVHMRLAELLHSDLDFFKTGLVNRYEYFKQYLVSKNIYLGHEQLKQILLKYKNWHIEQVIDFGYRPRPLNESDYYNPVLDYSNWLADDNSQNSKQAISKPIRDKKNSLQDYFNEKFTIWQKTLDQMIDVSTSRKTERWLANFFQNLINNNFFNVLSEQAWKVMPTNSWQSMLRVKLQDYFKNNFEHTKKLPKYFLVQLDYEQDFISYFCRNFSVEINDNLVPLIFSVSQGSNPASAQGSWNLDKFIAELKISEPNLLNDLRYIWRALAAYQTIYLNLVHVAALVLLSDVMHRYLNPADKQAKSLAEYKKIIDKEKLVIHGGRADDGNAVLNHRQNPDSLIAINVMLEKLHNFNRVEEEKVRLAKILAEINRQLSIIPYIKYAPRNLKIFRLNISRIEAILRIKIAELTDNHLRDLVDIAHETWLIYTEIEEDEASYPYKYRYLHIAFNNTYLRVNHFYKKDFIDFLKITAEYKKNKKAPRNFLLSQLHDATLFKNTLTNKNLFFVYVGRSYKGAELNYLLESIRIIKGMEAEIYVDSSNLEDKIKQDILAYINPENIIPLKSDQ